MALSDNAIYANTGLVLQAGFRRSRTHLALSDNAIYANASLVLQAGFRTPGPVLPAGLHRIHKWHCLTMPIVQVLDNPWCYTDCIFGIVWQCQLCTLVPVLPAGLHRIHNWHCLTMPIVHSRSGITCQITQNPQLALSDNANCASRR